VSSLGSALSIRERHGPHGRGAPPCSSRSRCVATSVVISAASGRPSLRPWPGSRVRRGIVICLWAWSTVPLRLGFVARREGRPLASWACSSASICGDHIGTGYTIAAHATILGQPLAVHNGPLGPLLIPAPGFSFRNVGCVLFAYSGIGARLRLRGPRGADAPGDLIVTVAGILACGRTVYRVGRVHRLDPVKLLLAQAVVGAAFFTLSSLRVRAATTPM